MGTRYEVRFSGSGGQGLILIGRILAEAVALYEDRYVTQSQSYGPEARGGASRSEVIISDEEIDYPKAIEIDFMLALTQEACDKYHCDLKKGGILLTDSRFVRNLPKGDFHIYRVPIIDTAEKEIGKRLVANILALGIFAELSGVVSTKALEKAILSKVPKGTEDLNKRAFWKGVEMGRRLKDTSS